MKKIMAALLGFILVMGLMSCDVSNKSVGMSLDTLNIKGEVISVKMETVSGFTGEPASDYMFDMGYTFNGNREIFFNDDGMVDYHHDYLKDGSLANEKYYFYDANSIVEMLHETFYRFGEIVRESELRFETKDDKVVLEDNVMTGRMFDLLDEDHVIYYVKYELDEDMRAVKSLNYSDGIKARYDHHYTYNDAGYITQVTNLMDEGLSTEISFEYDEDNNMKRVTLTRISKQKKGETIVYDYEHKLDDQGNWIEQKIFRGADHKYTTTRTIDYK